MKKIRATKDSDKNMATLISRAMIVTVPLMSSREQDEEILRENFTSCEDSEDTEEDQCKQEDHEGSDLEALLVCLKRKPRDLPSFLEKVRLNAAVSHFLEVQADSAKKSLTGEHLDFARKLCNLGLVDVLFRQKLKLTDKTSIFPPIPSMLVKY